MSYAIPYKLYPTGKQEIIKDKEGLEFNLTEIKNIIGTDVKVIPVINNKTLIVLFNPSLSVGDGLWFNTLAIEMTNNPKIQGTVLVIERSQLPESLEVE